MNIKVEEKDRTYTVKDGEHNVIIAIRQDSAKASKTKTNIFVNARLSFY